MKLVIVRLRHTSNPSQPLRTHAAGLDSTWTLCGKVQTKDGYVLDDATADDVTCKRCRGRLAARGLIGAR